MYVMQLGTVATGLHDDVEGLPGNLPPLTRKISTLYFKKITQLYVYFVDQFILFVIASFFKRKTGKKEKKIWVLVIPITIL